MVRVHVGSGSGSVDEKVNPVEEVGVSLLQCSVPSAVQLWKGHKSDDK